MIKITVYSKPLCIYHRHRYSLVHLQIVTEKISNWRKIIQQSGGRDEKNFLKRCSERAVSMNPFSDKHDLQPSSSILEKNNNLSNSVTVEELEHLYWQYSPSIWLPFYKTLWSPDSQWCYMEHPLRAQHPCATIIRHPLSSLYFLCSYSMKMNHFTPSHRSRYAHNFMYVFRKMIQNKKYHTEIVNS